MAITDSVTNARKRQKISSSFGEDLEDKDLNQCMNGIKQGGMSVLKSCGRRKKTLKRTYASNVQVN